MTLETTWFILWGVLWAVYFMLDGFDLGLGTLMPFLAKDDTERRVIYNAQGPFWDGNEVWLITAGGVTFAAFPNAYAAMFSGLYTALMLLLFALIVRGVSFEFRHQIDSPGWKKVWDTCHIVGSFVPALLLGTAFANIFQGIPLNQDWVNQGNLLSLLNPYGLAGGVLFVIMFMMHGALWLCVKSTGPLHDRAAKFAAKLWPIEVVAVVLFLVFTAGATKLFSNYLQTPVLFLILVIPVAGLFMMRPFIGKQNWWGAWGSSAAVIGGATMFGVIGLYPAILPSSLNPGWSLTIHNAASSPLTLKIMLGVALVFVPIVIIYQAWVYKLFSFKITEEDLHY